nr:lipid II flippase MurJ [Intrasporangium calvum]
MDHTDDLAVRRLGDGVGHRAGRLSAAGPLPHGVPLPPRWGLRGVGLGGVSRLAVWAFVGLAVSQVGFFITQWVLNTAAHRSGRPPDDPLRATSVYAVAFTIFMLPHAFIAVSIITALFPRLSKAAADQDVAGFKADFRRGMLLPLVANVPVMVFVMVAATPIVALLTPGIDGPSIELAGIVLVVMILGIVPFGVDLLCYRVFFALEDGRSPLLMQAVLTTVSLTGGIITLALDPKWAIAVVATAQTLGNVASSTTGILLLRRKLGLLGLAEIVNSTARIGVAAAGAGLLAWGTMTVLSPILGDPTAPSSAVDRIFTSGIVLGFAGLLFAVVYLALAHALHVREVRDVADMVRRRLA